MANAILMASGMGTRMRPLTETVPKPLITVGNKPMIETVIDGLVQAGVEKIVVVIGYLGNQFGYLTEKYSSVSLVENTVFEHVNNISSVFAARDTLLEGDCYICEADLYAADASIFITKHETSCYYGKMVPGHSDDWVFDVNDEGYIMRVGKVGDDCYNMCGIAFFKAEDAKILSEVMEAEYGAPGYETLFWDDVVNRHIDRFKLRVFPVSEESIVEIDTVAELETVRAKYIG